MRLLQPGTSVTVRSPATSANLGPGFDCLGMALDLWDEYRATVSAVPGVRVVSIGEGAGELPADEQHLVARCLLQGLADAEADAIGLDLVCHNTIPHCRGLGSSSAAIVGGLTLARGLLGDGSSLDDQRVLALANVVEGHPDNVAAAVLGGATIAWIDEDGTGRAVRIDVDPAIDATVLIPQSRTATEAARGMLPAQVPYQAAVFNLSRTALLVRALSGHPELLFTATADRLHQDFRAEAYPASLAAVAALRAAGIPSVISGAGPSVLAFAPSDSVMHVAPVRDGGFTVRALSVAGHGAQWTAAQA